MKGDSLKEYNKIEGRRKKLKKRKMGEEARKKKTILREK